jgi:hypothetical protein
VNKLAADVLKTEILAGMPSGLGDVLPIDFFLAFGSEPNWEEVPAHHALYYRLCFAVAERLHPRRILEIGVRLGYSLGPLMAGAGDALVYAEGWDTEGFVSGSIEKAARNLGMVGLTPRLYTIDSRDVSEVPHAFDLVHVDASHTYEAASHDLGLAQQANAVLVDDYHPQNHPGVFRAVDEFAVRHPAFAVLRFRDEDFFDLDDIKEGRSHPTKGAALLVRR